MFALIFTQTPTDTWVCGVLGFPPDLMADGGWCCVDHAGIPLRNHDEAVAAQHKSSFVVKLAGVRTQAT